MLTLQLDHFALKSNKWLSFVKSLVKTIFTHEAQMTFPCIGICTGLDWTSTFHLTSSRQGPRGSPLQNFGSSAFDYGGAIVSDSYSSIYRFQLVFTAFRGFYIFYTFIGEYFRHQPVSSTETKTQKQEHKSKMTKLSLSFKSSSLVHEVSQRPVQASPTTPELPSD